MKLINYLFLRFFSKIQRKINFIKCFWFFCKTSFHKLFKHVYEISFYVLIIFTNFFEIFFKECYSNSVQMFYKSLVLICFKNVSFPDAPKSLHGAPKCFRGNSNFFKFAPQCSAVRVFSYEVYFRSYRGHPKFSKMSFYGTYVFQWGPELVPRPSKYVPRSTKFNRSCACRAPWCICQALICSAETIGSIHTLRGHTTRFA